MPAPWIRMPRPTGDNARAACLAAALSAFVVIFTAFPSSYSILPLRQRRGGTVTKQSNDVYTIFMRSGSLGADGFAAPSDVVARMQSARDKTGVDHSECELLRTAANNQSEMT